MPLNYETAHSLDKEKLQTTLSTLEEKDLDSSLTKLISDAARFHDYALLINLFELDKNFIEHARGIADYTIENYRVFNQVDDYKLMTLLEILNVPFEKHFSSNTAERIDVYNCYQDYNQVWVKGESHKADLHNLLREFVVKQWFLAALQGNAKLMKAIKDHRILNGARFNKATVYQPELSEGPALPPGGPGFGAQDAEMPDASEARDMRAYITFGNGERVYAGSGIHADAAGVSRSTVNGEHLSINSIKPEKFFQKRYVNLSGQSVIDPKITDPTGRSALHFAVQGGQLSTVKFALDECAIDPNVADKDESPETPIQLRVRLLGENPKLLEDPILIALGYKPVAAMVAEAKGDDGFASKEQSANKIFEKALAGKGNFLLFRSALKAFADTRSPQAVSAVEKFYKASSGNTQKMFNAFLADARNPAKKASKEVVELAVEVTAKLSF